MGGNGRDKITAEIIKYKVYPLLTLQSSALNFLLLYSLFFLQLLISLFIYLILFPPRSLSHLFQPLCRFVSLYFITLLTFSHITYVNVFMAVISCRLKFELGGEELVCN